MNLEKKHIPELDGKLVTFMRQTQIHFFDPSMDSGNMGYAEKGDTLMLSGDVWCSGSTLVWLGIDNTRNAIICLHAGDAGQVEMDDTGGSLGSFIGRLKLPFQLPVTEGGLKKFNNLLKKLLLLGLGAAVLSNLSKQTEQ